MLKFENISHYYPNSHKEHKIEVLKDINFEASKGEFISIIGPSGCGKTTLANIITGYLKPITGRVVINGQELNKPSRERILMNQGDDLFDWMTVEQNIKLGMKDAKDINSYLELIKLNGFENYYPYELSGGMKKRVSLARALAANPNFIILDEPFGSLDYQIREELHQELIQIWQKTNKTIILITHDIEEAIFLSSKIIALSARPAMIKKILSVPFSYPRKIDLKARKDFIDLKIKIRETLNKKS